MSKSLNIIQNSLRLTLQELKVNKLRTTLSLMGIAFGIFCIIGVLALVNSLQQNIQSEINTLGNNTIYIDKWEYGNASDKPMWKYRARPTMKFEEAEMIKQRSSLLDDDAFLVRSGGNISVGDNIVTGAPVYGIVSAYIKIQPLSFAYGRYLSDAEFNNGTNTGFIGYTLAENLFGIPERALGKQVEFLGKKINIIGVIKKEGNSFINFNYDNCLMLPYYFSKSIINDNNSNPVIIAKGKDGVSTDALSNELLGIMRQIRRLSPTSEDNFTLNSVQAFSKSISSFFGILDIVGAFIGIICLIVGLFGIANIMFVTVKERTSVIGLKKAIGARQNNILFEFLMEAILLCIIGGIMGLIMVYCVLTLFSHFAHFPIFLSLPILILAILICIVVGILAGIIPARRASKLDPVVAIRS